MTGSSILGLIVFLGVFYGIGRYLYMRNKKKNEAEVIERLGGGSGRPGKEKDSL